MKVLCLWYANEEEINLIKSKLPAGTEVVAPRGDYLSRFDCSYADTAKLAVDADAMIGLSLPEGLLEVAKKLKMFCWMHSGVDDIRQFGALNHFKQHGIKLANIRGSNANAVAEHAMMFVLALAKKTMLKHQASLERDRLLPLYGDENRSTMLDGRTMTIIGLGSIGSRIAKHAKGFDMRVVGIRRNKGRSAENVDSMHGMDELHAVLAQSDFVVLAAPSTRETYQFFGRAEFEAMKASAYLVNVSRGMLIQEKALHEALTSGRLRGFAADVWGQYPYGRFFPVHWGSRLQIHRLPNVLSSYDQAANADDVLHRNIEWGTQSLADFAAGRPITREVNLDLGY